MQPPMKSYSWLSLLAMVLLGVSLARTAPRQANSYVVPLALWQELASRYDFPEPEEKLPQEIPEPRALYVDLEDPQDGRQDVQQVLLLTSGLTPAQIAQRSQNVKSEGRFLGHGTTVVVFTGSGSGGVSNNNTNNIVTNATAVPASTATTGTRTSEFIRAPLGYQYPMQYFRKRQDDASSPALSYPELFGWNEAALYGGDGLGQSYAGLGGLNGGYSLPAAGVPLVPITIGNEVRYVPMNLRMFRQLASGPAPSIREQEDRLEEDNMAGFELEATGQEVSDEENEVTPSGHSSGGSTGFGLLGQRLRPRPVVRRRPLQSLAQNIRRVQYLRN
ncbi:uncharacterized protein LOC128260403 [Drosophila gunungcola]|uniref:Uncharacterized protein n=1 Tax=Drosophila gunungcola TaxID=103775 RepID=A0A9P9YFI9_9MUSC|nr:uncharacterized protein LOC128260403 [Drosophila gunungcola]KAI8036033.1 hypothetical protein M5D96_011127 [Drosophila gunungcola]